MSFLHTERSLVAKRAELCYNGIKGSSVSALSVDRTMAVHEAMHMFTFSGAIEGTGVPMPYG